MKVTVMTPARQKIVLEAVETLRDIKVQVMEKTAIPVRQQLIYFRGRLLKSLRRPLAAYNVRDQSTVYLVKKLDICRCRACRNSRCMEREEEAAKRRLLEQLLGERPSVKSTPSAEVAVMTVDQESDFSLLKTTPPAEAGEEDGALAAVLEEQPDPGDIRTDIEQDSDVLQGAEYEEAEDDEVGEEEAEETVEEIGEEEEDEVEVEDAEEEGEDKAEVTEENQEPEITDEEEEEVEEEEEQEEVEDLDEVVEAVEIEEDEEEEAEETEEEDADIHVEDDESPEVEEADADDENILYSLATDHAAPENREELELTTSPLEDGEEEDRAAQVVFPRQAHFEEDGANSVGEENPDVGDVEEEDAVTIEDPMEDENLLLAMTRPSRNDEDLLAPPEDLESGDPYAVDEDPGYMSGDEMDDL